MAADNRQIQSALIQMLENFRRCGISRFGSLPANELPAEWLERIAELNRTPAVSVPASPLAVAPPPSANASSKAPLTATDPSSVQAAIPSSGQTSREQIARGQISNGQPDSRTNTVGQPIAGVQIGGLAAEPWSLPVLESDQRQQRLDTLESHVRDCRKCTAIVDHRQQTVFGVGPLHPVVCFMGEAPGADEDRSGKPFVGKAGQLLTKIITAMKLRREDVFILNALKCRPPQNRTPVNEEIDNCRHYMEEQLNTLQPKFIVCLGAVAVRSLLQSELSIGRLRGKFYQYRGSRVVVTYHPSYLLRNESAKKLVWDDMKMLMAELPPA